MPFNKSQTLWEQQEPCLYQRPWPPLQSIPEQVPPKDPHPVLSACPSLFKTPSSLAALLLLHQPPALPCPQAQGPFPSPSMYCSQHQDTETFLLPVLHSHSLQAQRCHFTTTQPFNTRTLHRAPNHRKEFDNRTTKGQKRETWQLQLRFR